MLKDRTIQTVDERALFFIRRSNGYACQAVIVM